MSSVKHAIIAAAGLGSRLGLGRTKCLLELNNRPLISYLLALLKDVEDVRVVVGFQEHEVMDEVLRYRKDVTFVRNPEYLSTSTLTSYWLGSQGIKENCLFMDADIIFEPESFMNFKKFCMENVTDNIIAVTEAKTRDAVFVESRMGKVTQFTREQETEYEWANLCFIHPDLLVRTGESVYKQLTQYLPLTMREIVSFEIDTKCDMEKALYSSIASDRFYSTSACAEV
ncbi:NTP transferase domain-containing protein [Enterobacteriaceae bacterium H20N1]|uniref:NTP transferase domain-containing protein n=1 Tax=Dryocola boscaweniae TaxID=2925397 RepID=A0A9X3AC61_9ENTR|nr:NTP transferase domain-containing protein [Dryocola boscaweniae]MCT4701568.1 NTP transferase domain-containing protein [Dryocola boscaweniae]MCT4716210.1 NTP transferase domain-containing protein [Dryocola boscaweniae]MCT4718737.1 NTP transferase domain-containing protein [Dryocola boscaweniae]